MGKDLHMYLCTTLNDDDDGHAWHTFYPVIPGLGRHEKAYLSPTRYSIVELDDKIAICSREISSGNDYYTEMMIYCVARQMLKTCSDAYKYVSIGYC